jgi:hypothetical protein
VNQVVEPCVVSHDGWQPYIQSDHQLRHRRGQANGRLSLTVAARSGNMVWGRKIGLNQETVLPPLAPGEWHVRRWVRGASPCPLPPCDWHQAAAMCPELEVRFSRLHHFDFMPGRLIILDVEVPCGQYGRCGPRTAPSSRMAYLPALAPHGLHLSAAQAAT